MDKLIDNIPILGRRPLEYVFENLKFHHIPGSLWLEFGVAGGGTINYISRFSQNDTVYGFDSFKGLPENWRDGFAKGAFDLQGNMPMVYPNVKLIPGWFNETLDGFLKQVNGKISFIHIDCDIYSSTKYIFNTVKDRLEKDCVIVFDELINYDGFDGDNGELRAFYEFITENNVKYTWIGCKGAIRGMTGGLSHSDNESVALIIHSVN